MTFCTIGTKCKHIDIKIVFLLNPTPNRDMKLVIHEKLHPDRPIMFAKINAFTDRQNGDLDRSEYWLCDKYTVKDGEKTVLKYRLICDFRS